MICMYLSLDTKNNILSFYNVVYPNQFIEHKNDTIKLLFLRMHNLSFSKIRT